MRVALDEIVWRRWPLRNADFEVLVRRVTSHKVDTLRSLLDIEVVELAFEGDDARLDCVFPDQEADLREEGREERERGWLGHAALL